MSAEPRQTTAREAWTKWESQVVDGRFTLRRCLGWSDRAAVFLTEHKAKNLAEAAIKFVRTDAPQAKSLLVRWQTAMALSHPHLIQLFEVGRWQSDGNDFLFVVMEYGDQTLAEILRRRALSGEEARELLPPVLDALTFLHRRQLVHGQLKPSNFLAVADQLKLSSDTIRPAGPDDAAGDVFDLGATLFEALTNRAWSPSDPSLDMASLPAEVPASLIDTMRRCLSPTPADRPIVIEMRAEYKLIPPPASDPGSGSTLSVPTPSRAAAPRNDIAPQPATNAPREVSPPQAGVATSREVTPLEVGLAGSRPISQPAGSGETTRTEPGVSAARETALAQPAGGGSRTAAGREAAANISREATAAQSAARSARANVAPQSAINGSLEDRTSRPSESKGHPNESKRHPLRWIIAAAVFLSVSLWGWSQLTDNSQLPSQPAVAAAPPLAPTPTKPAAPTRIAAAEPTVPQPLPSPSEQTNPASEALSSDVLHEVLPNIPEKILNGIQGRVYVTVRVLVGPDGNVIGALMENPGPSKYFARLSEQAARQWQFVSAETEASRVWLLRFQFTRDGVAVHTMKQ